MKRQLIAIGVGGLIPLVGAAVIAVAVTVEAAALGIRHLVHR